MTRNNENKVMTIMRRDRRWRERTERDRRERTGRKQRKKNGQKGEINETQGREKEFGIEERHGEKEKRKEEK